MTHASSWDRDNTYIKGQTGVDGSGDPIGENITSSDDGDKHRLHVDAKISGGDIGAIPTIDNRLQYDDMNTSSGGVSRKTSIGSSFTTVYEYDGSGLFMGFVVNMESSEKDWYIRLIVDGVDVFIDSGGILTKDLFDDKLYDYEPGGNTGSFPHVGFAVTDHGAIRWKGPSDFPMTFSSSVEIQLRKTSGSKKFYAGLASLVKVT